MLPLLSSHCTEDSVNTKDNVSPPGRRTLRQISYRITHSRACWRRYLTILLAVAFLVYAGLYIFHPNVKGVFLMVMRTHLPFLDSSTTEFPSFHGNNGNNNKVCVMQSFDENHKHKYADFLGRNRAWAEAQGFDYVPYTAEFHRERNHQGTPTIAAVDTSPPTTMLSHDHSWTGFTTSLAHNVFPWELRWYSIDPVQAEERPHFLKFHGMKYLLFDQDASRKHNCEYVLYIDSDAVIGEEDPASASPAINYAPPESNVEIVFGNEVFVAAMDSMRNHPSELPFNSGYMLVKKSEFTHQFIRDVLTHPRCDICRIGPCTVFGYYDQGCMEKLFQNEYKSEKHRFGTAQIQTTKLTPGFLLCHLAGLSKDLRREACSASAASPP